MFERFTERARAVVVLAQEEARALGHGHIGTEHILLGLLRESDGTAARILEASGVTLTEARERVARLVPVPEQRVGSMIPFTKRAKLVLEMALREALRLGDSHIETGHILLALATVDDGIARSLLLDHGLDPESTRAEIVAMRPGEAQASPSGPQPRTITSPLLPADVRAFLAEIEQEIRDQLGRAPDVADYWLALASVPGSLGARALTELGIDAAALAQAIERARAEGGSPLGGLTPDQAARHARLLFGLSSPD